MERKMNTKPLVKTLVTVQTVRAANGKVMGLSQGATAPVAPSIRISEKLGSVSVARAGQLAMQSAKK